MTTYAISGILFSYFNKDYDEGFKAGIKYEKKMRKQQHDSILANCKWNNGVPTKIRDGYKE